MSITGINPVVAKPAAESLSVENYERSEVSPMVADEFAMTVGAGAPAKPDYSNATLEDVAKLQTEAILNNIINESAAQRQQLKEVMEEQN